MEPIFLEPVLQDKIWGGTKLKSEFGLELPSETVGEAWVISAHPNGCSRVKSPKSFAGLSLQELYTRHSDLFDDHLPDKFPLLVKILDAREALSVQVHPDDDYARVHENELGKTECWYIMSAEPGATIIYGHNAESADQFEQMVEEGEWENLLRHVPVKTGDFYYVPSGTIHAIGAGIVILEIQQNSDTTYRVYDFDRMDHNGDKRDLHIQKALEVTTFPHKDPQLNVVTTKEDKSSITHFIDEDYFSVCKWQVEDELAIDLDETYYLATVIRGEGRLLVDGSLFDLKLADSFILPVNMDRVLIKGNLELMVATSSIK